MEISENKCDLSLKVMNIAFCTDSQMSDNIHLYMSYHIKTKIMVNTVSVMHKIL